MRLTVRAVALVLAFSAAAPLAPAHDFAFTDVRLGLGADSRFTADVTADLDALALGVDASADSAALAREIEALPAAERDALAGRLAELFQRRVRVRFDGEPAAFTVSFPERGRGPAPGGPSALGLVARLEGRIPPQARTVTVFASRAFPPVRLTVGGADGAARAVEVLARGEESRPLSLEAAGPPPGIAVTFGRFVGLGFTHILPGGLDHVLFVAALALAARGLALLAQATAFTVAHTVALALAVSGVVALPSSVVEPLITASIGYVGLENLARKEPSRARLALVFAFGLLHGLGFAGALAAVGWPSGRTVAALLGFNLGVELGQLAVIGLVLALIAAAARAGVARPRLTAGLSAVIGATGAAWTVTRLAGLHLL